MSTNETAEAQATAEEAPEATVKKRKATGKLPSAQTAPTEAPAAEAAPAETAPTEPAKKLPVTIKDTPGVGAPVIKLKGALTLAQLALQAHEASVQPELEAERLRLEERRQVRGEALKLALFNVLGVDAEDMTPSERVVVDGQTFTVLDGPDGKPDEKLYLHRVTSTGADRYEQVKSIQHLGELLSRGV